MDTVRQTTTGNKPARVYLARPARQALARLNPDRREALRAGLLRVGCYPQQCYPRTARYVLDHPEIDGLHLVHGVASHPPHFIPFDHAWVEVPGQVVFDGVVQTFFTQSSYYRVMAAVALDAYSGPAARRLVARMGTRAPGTPGGCPHRGNCWPTPMS
jgi:hypothetical protein